MTDTQHTPTTQCQRCGGKSIVFLCRKDIEAFVDMLHGLPRFLYYLSQAALGQARLGSPQRRHKGDEQPMAYNAKAARLYADAHTILVTWVRHLCEHRGIDVPTLHTELELCWWLENNVNAIAADEAAGECFGEIEDLIKRIERQINRPIPPRILGPCITDPAPDEILAKRRDDGDRETRCNRQLRARREDREVTCPQCHRTHDVAEIVDALMDESGHMLFSVRELVDWVLPLIEEPVPVKTLERWIRDLWIPVRGFDPAGAQMVMLAEVREVRRTRPRHAKRPAKVGG